MSTTTAGAALTAQHRAKQVNLRAVTVRDLMRLWRLFDPKAISQSWERIEPLIVDMIQARRPMSSALTAEYLRAFGLAEVGAAPASVAASTLTVDEIVPNLRLLGPGNAWNLTNKGRSALDVSRVTLTMIEGEVTRQTLNGGRQQLTDTIGRDQRIRGYTRVTDGSPCAFCAMTAGRGPVYRSEGSASFEAHRKCACTGEPVYFTDAPWSPSAQKWRSLYRDADRAIAPLPPGRRGRLQPDSRDRAAEVRREFRRLYEATTTG